MMDFSGSKRTGVLVAKETASCPLVTHSIQSYLSVTIRLLTVSAFTPFPFLKILAYLLQFKFIHFRESLELDAVLHLSLHCQIKLLAKDPTF
jgi:hypothetical protein